MILERIIEFLVVLPFFTMLVNFLERKLMADAQTRVGPRLVGASGFFQPIADFFSLLMKRSYRAMPAQAAFFGVLVCSVIGSAVFLLPSYPGATSGEGGFTLFILIVTLSIHLVLQLLFSNHEDQERVYQGVSKSLVIGFSALFVFFLVILSSALIFGSFQWSEILQKQSASILAWGFFSFFPFGMIEAICFCVSGMILFRVSPLFDQSGTSSVGGIDRLILEITQSVSFYLYAIVMVSLFFGGANLPFGLSQQQDQAGWISALGFVFMLLKAILISVAIKIILQPIALIDSDQALALIWKYTAPAAVLGIFGIGVWQWMAH